MVSEDLEDLLKFFSLLLFFSSSFSVDNFHWLAFKFTSLLLNCIQFSVKHIQWTIQFWYYTSSVLEFLFRFLFVGSISLLTFPIFSHILPLFSIRPLHIFSAVTLKLLTINCNVWVIYGLLLLIYFSIESHFLATFGVL